jgi:transcriptional regulator GlxA family with amidase domain
MPDPVLAVVTFAGISPFHLAVPCLVFDEDRRNLGVPRFPVRVCALEGGSTATTSGYSIQAAAGLEGLEDADIIIVPSWRDIDERPPAVLLDALRAAHARGAVLVGLCLGSFVLAAAGLLDNRAAATHWAYAEDLAARYPAIQVKPDDLYVDDGDIITSAGVAAGLDCCLHLLRRLCGAEIAVRVARRIVVPPHRQGGQAQFIEKPALPGSEIDRFTTVMEAVQREPAGVYSIDQLAKRAAMSRRSFTRHFRQRMGTTFLEWLTQQRLALVQRALETTDRPVETIAHDTGFGSAVSLRQHFRAAFMTSPADYRRAFRL